MFWNSLEKNIFTETNRMSDEEKQEAHQNLPLAKFGARFEWIGEYMKRFDFGGPDGIRKDKDNDGLIDAAKYARNYMILAILITILFFTNHFSKYRVFERGAF